MGLRLSRSISTEKQAASSMAPRDSISMKYLAIPPFPGSTAKGMLQVPETLVKRFEVTLLIPPCTLWEYTFALNEPCALISSEIVYSLLVSRKNCVNREFRSVPDSYFVPAARVMGNKPLFSCRSSGLVVKNNVSGRPRPIALGSRCWIGSFIFGTDRVLSKNADEKVSA